jgi:hypothetical protein
MRMKMKARPAVAGLLFAVLTLLLLGLVPSAGAGGSKMNVCHRTGSKSNPYVGIRPSSNAKGHSTHPEKNSNKDHMNQPGWQKGPHQASNSCQAKSTCPPGSTDPDCGSGPPPVCVPPDPLCTEGGGGNPPPGTFAGPAGAIAGQPTVTG